MLAVVVYLIFVAALINKVAMYDLGFNMSRWSHSASRRQTYHLPVLHTPFNELFEPSQPIIAC